MKSIYNCECAMNIYLTRDEDVKESWGTETDKNIYSSLEPMTTPGVSFTFSTLKALSFCQAKM
jgi:hypothetical protein